MRIEEMECNFFDENLLTIKDRGALKNYVKPINENQNILTDTFCIINCRDGSFEIYVSDSERGIPYFNLDFDSEDEACEKLYEYVKLFKIIELKFIFFFLDFYLIY